MASAEPSGERKDGPSLGHAHVATLLRQHDPDRFFAGLFAPADKRPHLFALYAFAWDVGRVRAAARQPAAGEIRLQWWHDALAGGSQADVAAHPLAAALLAAVEKFRLPRQAFFDLLEARRFDLYDDPMPAVADLEGYCGETSSILMRLACLVLADGADAGSPDAAGHAGVAYAVTGLLRAFPWHARSGQLYVPADILGRHNVTRDDILAGRGGAGLRNALRDVRTLASHHHARFEAARPSLPRGVRAAFLPVALLPLYLAQMERHDYDPYLTTVEVPQWRRQWALWRAARKDP